MPTQRRLPTQPPQRHGTSGQSIVEFALVAPIMVVLLFAIIDFARIYTTMMSVESAAREAADYGTTLGAGKWQVGPPMDQTVIDMRERACLAASNLSDYTTSGTDADGDGLDDGCTNPSFDYCITAPPSTTCGPVNIADGCEVPTREPPCLVTVTLTYEFHLIAPVNFQIMGASIGLPNTITVERDSTYAMTDLDVSATPPPGP
jgi:TadE-like protein